MSAIKDCNCCQKFQDVVFGNMEKFFKKFGSLVGNYPYITILISLVISGLFMIGFLAFRQEMDMVELWVPDETEFYKNNKWVHDNFHSSERIQHYLVASKNGANILTKDNFKILLNISINMDDVSTTVG